MTEYKLPYNRIQTKAYTLINNKRSQVFIYIPSSAYIITQ